MEQLGIGALLRNYIKYRIGVIILFAVCIFFSVATAWVTNTLREGLYAVIMCIYLGIIFAVIDFIRFRHAHIKLYSAYFAAENISEEITSYGGLISDDFNKIVSSLAEQLHNTESNARRRETEAKDYYTLWTHQIKTPIAAMKLILENGGGSNDMLKGELFRIEQYSEMALQYIRLESISGDMLLKKYNVRDLAASALKKYFTLFSMKKLSLEFPEFALEAVTDEKWLCFVIEQLLSNSIKYTHVGGISITADGSKLVISDTGIGISADDLPRICERGFTGYNGRMDKKSTGLGLYLCRKITEELGHKLEITSEKGKGTSVTIDFTQFSAI